MSMRALSFISTVAVTAMLTAGAGGAAADTLFTNASHTVTVSIGTTASIGSGTVTAIRDGTVVNACASSTLDLQLEQNNALGVAGTLTGGSFTSCFSSAAGDFPWRFTVRGSGTANLGTTFFTNATWEDVSATLWGVSPGNGTLTDAASGAPPTDGVYLREAGGNGSSMCFVLNNAGTLSGPLLSDGKIDATYCFEDNTAWSLGSTALPPVGTGTATLFTTAAHTTRVSVGATGRLTVQGALAFTTGSLQINSCPGSTLTLRLTQNSDAASVQGTVTSGTLFPCSSAPYQGTFPWSLSIGGLRQVNGASATYPNTTLANLKYDYLGNVVTGTIGAARSSTSTGLYASQPTGPGAPICLVMNHATDLVDPIFGTLNLNGAYCFTGEPASTWSLT